MVLVDLDGRLTMVNRAACSMLGRDADDLRRCTFQEITHPDDDFHLVCTECGAVDHHVGTLVQTVRDHLQDGHGFAVDQVDLTVRGRCAACGDTAG